MEKQTMPKTAHVENRHKVICDTYKQLIDIGSQSTAAIQYISDNSKDLFGDQYYSTKAVFGRLKIAGLTGPNGYKKKESVQETQPA